MKYWEIITDNLSTAGWSWGCVAAIDSKGQTIWIVDAHRDNGKRLVEQIFPKAYGLLLNHLMSSISKRLSSRELRASMRDVGRSLAKEHGDQLTKKSRNERLLAALDLLKKLGGAVALHETGGKTLIRGKSCPLAAITAHYPDACLIVEALLTEMMGVPVKEHCTHGEPPRCCFEVQLSAPRH
jgi:predicted ArsR family transcriptional regulator